MIKIKKVLFSLVFTFFLVSSTYAINWDDVINQYVTIIAWTNEEFEIPSWYDLYVENASVTVDAWWTTDINVYDSWSLMYSWEFPEWNTFWTYNIIFRETLNIDNVWSKNASVIYYWYLFKEWTNLNVWPNNEVSENWWVIPDEEFMRQDELYQFYELELTALMLLLIIQVTRKLSFRKKLTLNSFK